jgi:vacuolar protein sorting-associated protein IST1
MIEGMEIVEMYCDLLLARFGLVESMKLILQNEILIKLNVAGY